MKTLCARPDFFVVFEKLGREFGVPILRVKPSEQSATQAPPATANYLLDHEPRFQAEGVLRLDSLCPNPARGATTFEARRKACLNALRTLRPAVRMVILHPGFARPELSAAASRAQTARQAAAFSWKAPPERSFDDWTLSPCDGGMSLSPSEPSPSRRLVLVGPDWKAAVVY